MFLVVAAEDTHVCGQKSKLLQRRGSRSDGTARHFPRHLQPAPTAPRTRCDSSKFFRARLGVFAKTPTCCWIRRKLARGRDAQTRVHGATWQQPTVFWCSAFQVQYQGLPRSAGALKPGSDQVRWQSDYADANKDPNLMFVLLVHSQRRWRSIPSGLVSSSHRSTRQPQPRPYNQPRSVFHVPIGLVAERSNIIQSMRLITAGAYAVSMVSHTPFAPVRSMTRGSHPS